MISVPQYAHGLPRVLSVYHKATLNATFPALRVAKKIHFDQEIFILNNCLTFETMHPLPASIPLKALAYFIRNINIRIFIPYMLPILQKFLPGFF